MMEKKIIKKKKKMEIKLMIFLPSMLKRTLSAFNIYVNNRRYL